MPLTDTGKRWFSRLLGYGIFLISAIVGGLLAGVLAGVVRGLLDFFFGPKYNAWLIKNWLENEPYYISEFSREKDALEPYRFKVQLTDSDHEIIIHPIRDNNFVRVVGSFRLDSGVLAVILDHRDAQRRLNTQIETALVNSRVYYKFINADGDPVDFENATGVLVEYRIYGDQLSRKEISDGLLKVDSTLNYIRSRSGSVAEDFEDYS